MLVTLLKRERPDNLELVKHWQGKDIRVSSRPKQTVQCDGEVLEESSFHITVIPGAINVLVPKEKSNVSE
jgi:diacylglycerol kinase family enzyme